MRKLVLGLGALAVIGFALPAASPASAETVVIKRFHRDHGFHRGFERHHWDRDRFHGRRTVIIKKGY